MKSCLLFVLTLFLSLPLFSQSCNPDSLLVRSIKGRTTDNTINWELQNHHVFINPDCVPNEKLLLHFIGSFDNPANTTFLPTLAANNGFKAIVLKYPNGVSATGACTNSADTACFWRYRQEILWGTNTSSQVTVDSTNSIFNRVLKLLVHLDSLYPTENWNHFLSGSNDIDWSDILVSGHSQGGGHAAFIAKQFEVERVLMFASPNDYSNNFARPAPWTAGPSVTPDSNYYALGNLHDDVVDFYKQFQTWTNLGLPGYGDTLNVDISTCPYGNSRMLFTRDTSSASVTSGNHNVMVLDNFTPVSSGVPVFAPVWEYMLGLCGNATSISASNSVNSSITAFPNPTSSALSLRSESEISRIEVYDLSGKLLMTFEPQSHEFNLELGPHKGLIFINVLRPNHSLETIKVIVN